MVHSRKSPGSAGKRRALSARSSPERVNIFCVSDVNAGDDLLNVQRLAADQSTGHGVDHRSELAVDRRIAVSLLLTGREPQVVSEPHGRLGAARRGRRTYRELITLPNGATRVDHAFARGGHVGTLVSLRVNGRFAAATVRNSRSNLPDVLSAPHGKVVAWRKVVSVSPDRG